MTRQNNHGVVCHPELTLTGLHAVTAFVPGGETDGETDVNIQCLMLNA
ncbi:TPA: hypothetical protein R4Y35_001980 [Escherichia coli]|nr:hypothetical protein [Escherichia coli]